MLLELVWRGGVLAIGAVIVFVVVRSAIRTFLLPRPVLDPIPSLVFRLSRRVFDWLVGFQSTYEGRDRIMANFVPVSLMILVPTLLFIMHLGFTLVFWGAKGDEPYQSFLISGSSLLTLGSTPPTTPIEVLLSYTEAIIGLTLTAIVIAYFPTMYGAFSQREVLVRQLETRAGSPPSAVYFFELAYPLGRMDLRDFWREWELWFAQIDETHTSLGPLSFFRSSQPHHHWITAAGTVLDAASLYQAVLAYPPDPGAALCIRAGYLALRHISDLFSVPYQPDPHFPRNSISISRLEFDQACDRLARAGLPLKADRDQAWTDFAGWRVNYDQTLLGLCTLLMAPEAPWSSDRMPAYRPLPLLSLLRKPKAAATAPVQDTR
jgi:hypothetical protein